MKQPPPPPTRYRCRLQLYSDGSTHEVELPVALSMYGQAIVTLVQGKACRYHAMGFVVTVLGTR